jgi:hypothetical protein
VLHQCRAATIHVPDDPRTRQRLADYLDCEGTIIIEPGPRTRTRICITNTYRPLMAWLVETVGGTVVRLSANHRVKGTKPCYDWVLQRTRDCLVFLQAVLPSLMIKRKDAIRAIRILRARLGEV